AEVEESGGFQEHALANGVCSEVLVPVHRDLDKFVPLATADHIFDQELVLCDPPIAKVDVGIVIALALEKVAQIARAFDQQVAIDALLLINRNVLAEIALGYLGLDSLDLHLGASLEVQGGVNPPRLLVV